METIELTLFADHHQFYLQDDDIRFGDLSNAWTPEAAGCLLAVADHFVGIGTVRNMSVPVRIAIDFQRPDLEPSEWDRINRAALVCDTGRVVVADCTDYFPHAKRIEVAPGEYDVLVAYRNLDSLSEDGLEGDDSYHVLLAPQRNGT